MPKATTASAPGKIILCGEYAVIFGHPGIAVPADKRVEVTYTPGNEWIITWDGVTGDSTKANAYVHTILDACAEQCAIEPGNLHISNTIPLGKGMGSSTALTIAVTKAIFGCHPEHSPPRPASRTGRGTLRKKILAAEDSVNPGHSGIDFAVIWEEKPVYFKKPNAPKPLNLPHVIIQALQTATLIDTGAPNETTPQLVTWITMRHVQGDKAIEPAIHTIGGCALRIQELASLSSVEAQQMFTQIIRDHHRAQVQLGIVNAQTQSLIEQIEQKGGCAKVIGAGGRTGGSGMVIAFEN